MKIMKIFDGSIRVSKGEAVMSAFNFTKNCKRIYVIIKTRKGKMVRRYLK